MAVIFISLSCRSSSTFNTSLQLTDVLTVLTSSIIHQTQNVGYVGYDRGISTIAFLTKTVFKPTDTTDSVSCVTGICMSLRLYLVLDTQPYIVASAVNPMTLPRLRRPCLDICLFRFFVSEFPSFSPFGVNLGPVNTVPIGAQTLLSVREALLL